MRNNIFTILKKELRRVFLDRKLAFTVFIMPGLTIAILYSVMGGMIEKTGDDAMDHVALVKTINVPSAFSDIASELYGDGMDVLPISIMDTEVAKKEVEAGDIDVLVIFREGSPAAIERYTNSVKDFSVRAGYMIDGIIDSMRLEVLGEKLGGIEETIIYNFTQIDLAKAEQRAGKAIGMLLPMLLTVFLFAGAMQVGMDIIAGEKERGTLSTMLLTPVKRSHIAIGKMLSLAIISLASCLSSLAGVLLSLPFSNSMFGGGFNVSDIAYSISDFALLIVQMIFMAVLFVSIICAMSALARNIKEAGGFIVPAYMIVLLMSMSSMFVRPEGLWGYFIPVYGNLLSIKDILMFEYKVVPGFAAIFSTLVFAGAMAFLMVRTFNSERIMKSA
ncbi:MAG: ABC transporter permease [Clostridia bacterium]|nr:ABC transporter permease [Clostridia bacterium]